MALSKGDQINRRKFLKILSWTPMGFLIPKALFAKTKVSPIIESDIYGYTSFVNKSGDGGFLVPQHIAGKIAKQLHQSNYIIARKFKMLKSIRG